MIAQLLRLCFQLAEGDFTTTEGVVKGVEPAAEVRVGRFSDNPRAPEKFHVVLFPVVNGRCWG